MSDFMNWIPDYSVGNKEIDGQHKEIINIINLLNAAIEKRKEKKALSYIIQKMMEYSIFHFSQEEQMMEKAGYPLKERHMLEHEKYIKQVEILNREFLNKEATVPQEVLIFLKKWWNSHILESDKDYSPHFSRR